jgi:hypothetical protein
MHIKDARISSNFTAKADTATAGAWPNRNALLALLTLALLILAISGCGGGYPNATQTTQASNSLEAIFVNANSIPSIAPGETIKLGASGGYSSSVPGGISYKDITNSAIWSTSNATVATLDKGLVTGTRKGPVIITRTLGSKKQRSVPERRRQQR